MPRTLFISYSHPDEKLKDELLVHLAALKREGLIGVWHDRMLRSGEHLDAAIEKQLASSDVILLLISASFINSDYCYQREMTRAFARATRGETIVVPIILRPCQWAAVPVERNTKLGDFVALPNDARPVSSFSDHDDVWNQVVSSLRSLMLAQSTVDTGPHTSQATLPEGAPDARPSKDRPKLSEQAEGITDALSRGVSTRSAESAKLYPFDHSILSAVERAAIAYERDGVVGLSTGLLDLDRLTSGLNPGELTCVSGLPKQSATLLAANLAFNIAKTLNTPTPEPRAEQSSSRLRATALFTLDLSARRLATILLAHVSGVAVHKIENGYFSADEFGNIIDRARKTEALPLFISDENPTMDSVIEAVTTLTESFELRIIIIDGLDLLGRRPGSAGRRAELAATLKSLAKELKVPVVGTIHPAMKSSVDQNINLEVLASYFQGVEPYCDAMWLTIDRTAMLERREPREGTVEHLNWQEEMDKHLGEVDIYVALNDGRYPRRARLAFDRTTGAYSNYDKVQS